MADQARILLLRAAVGLEISTEENKPKSPVKWFSPGIKNLLFVSVDIEAKADSLPAVTGLGYIFHCGVSILDTKALCSHARAISSTKKDIVSEGIVPPEVISYHFSVGRNITKENKEYLNRRLRFHFNAEHYTTATSVASRIRKILGTKPFVLVTHGGNTDHQFWKALDIGKKPLWTIDIGSIIPHCYPHRFSSCPTLKNLLDFLQIPYDNDKLHVAGYDAHYTLRALLVIAARCANVSELQNSCPPHFDWFSIQHALLGIGGGDPSPLNGTNVLSTKATRGFKSILNRSLQEVPGSALGVNKKLLKQLSRVGQPSKVSSGVKKPSKLPKVTKEGSRLGQRLTRSTAKILSTTDGPISHYSLDENEHVLVEGKLEPKQRLTRSLTKTLVANGESVRHFSLNDEGRASFEAGNIASAFGHISNPAAVHQPDVEKPGGRQANTRQDKDLSARLFQLPGLSCPEPWKDGAPHHTAESELAQSSCNISSSYYSSGKKSLPSMKAEGQDAGAMITQGGRTTTDNDGRIRNKAAPPSLLFHRPESCEETRTLNIGSSSMPTPWQSRSGLDPANTLTGTHPTPLIQRAPGQSSSNAKILNGKRPHGDWVIPPILPQTAPVIHPPPTVLPVDSLVASTQPGIISLVPAGPRIPPLDALLSTKPLLPARSKPPKMKQKMPTRAVSKEMGPGAFLGAPVNSQIRNMARRQRKLQLRAMRLLEDINKNRITGISSVDRDVYFIGPNERKQWTPRISKCLGVGLKLLGLRTAV